MTSKAKNARKLTSGRNFHGQHKKAKTMADAISDTEYADEPVVRIPLQWKNNPSNTSDQANTSQNFETPDDDADQYAPFVYPEDFTVREGQGDVEQFMARDDYRLADPYRDLPVPDHIVNDDYNNDREINKEPNTKMRAAFLAYCRNAQTNFRSDFTSSQRTAIALLQILRSKGAPLDAYDSISEWHLRASGKIAKTASVYSDKTHLSRAKAMKFLQDRYNLKDKAPQKVKVRLPFSEATVTITRHNAWDCMESLLTDPRVTDSDCNFLDPQDPFKPPPYPRVIGELHTGLAYYKAYKKYIMKPKQILLPIVMYIDGAATGQFRNLPITILKFALGIHTRRYRDKPHAWRDLGYVPPNTKASTRGAELYAETGHLDAVDPDVARGTSDLPTHNPDVLPNQPPCKAQDFHAILDCLLESYGEVQEQGFVWDF